MTPKQIIDQITDKFGDAISESHDADRHPRLHTTAEHWRSVAEFLRSEEALDFDFLKCLSGVDYVADEKLCVVYDLYSTRHDHDIAVKVYVDRGDAVIPSVMDLWPAANWHEREAYDMVGVTFEGHNDLRRILLPEDWEGYPLRKDYEFPREYHGIPGTYEMDWQQKSHYPN